MEVVYGFDKLASFNPGPLVLALGNFDGVHLGHQKIITTAVQKASRLGLDSAALIFNPHPQKILCPEKKLLALSDLEIKADLLARLGLDYMIVEPFTAKLSEMSPEKFLNKYLKDIIKVKGVVAGYDYTFGRKALGDTNLLLKWGQENKREVTVCPAVKAGNEPVSSSLIRERLVQGRVEEAADLLNYYFYRRGRVVPGRGKGQKLGFPTANLEINPELLLPRDGVYFTLVKKNGSIWPGAANVGRCPTFSLDQLILEVNIIDFEGDLYDEIITVFFIKKIRNEQVFSSPEELKKQVYQDVKKIRELSDSYLDNSSVLTGLT